MSTHMAYHLVNHIVKRMYRRSAPSTVQPMHDDNEVSNFFSCDEAGTFGEAIEGVRESPRLDIMQRINRPMYSNNIVERKANRRGIRKTTSKLRL